MARGTGSGKGIGARRQRGAKTLPAPATAPEAETAPSSGRKRPALLSPDAGTNLVIADIALRAAGGMLRNRMEKGLLVNRFGAADADRLVDGRSLVTTAMLYGASRLARRSPLGLAVVVGGLAAKVFYDRGKRLERADGKRPRTRRGTAKPSTNPSDSPS